MSPRRLLFPALLFWLLSIALFACDDDSPAPGDAGDDVADDADVTEDVADIVEDALDLADTPDAVDLAEEPDAADASVDADVSDARDLPADSSDATDQDASDLAEEPDEAGDLGEEPDSGAMEVPLDGFGELGGQCDFLDDAVWSFSGSWIFTNTLDFGDDEYDDGDLSQLSPGGQHMDDVGGLNDSSLLSEIFAYEVLYRCELARLLETEGTIEYANPNGPKTDFLARIDDRQIGVSVVRAHPLDPFAEGRAQALLEDKLQGILNSTANVTGEDVWERQILSVIAADARRVELLLEAYPLIDESLTTSTIIVITRTDGEDEPLYCEPPTVCPSP